MTAPTYLELDAWGGTPNGWPAMTLPAVALWVHHSVTNEDIGVTPTDDAVADFLELDALGLARGHGGISYSYAIHPEGVIGEGQGTRRGAHTGGDGCDGSPWAWNPCSFGVVFVGNFNEDTPTREAVNAFRWLRDVKLIGGGLLIPGVYPTGGHRDAPGNATACPGDNLEAIIEELRQPWAETPPEEAPMPVDFIRRPSDGNVYATDGQTKRYVPTAEWEGLWVKRYALTDIIDAANDDVVNGIPDWAPPGGGSSGGVTADDVRAIVNETRLATP